jgi:hypothetical protein
MDKRLPFGQIAKIALIPVQKNVYMFQLSKEIIMGPVLLIIFYVEKLDVRE